MTWKKDKAYQTKCVLAVCSKLEITDSEEMQFISEIAEHSCDDSSFFHKVKTLYGMDKKFTAANSKALEQNTVKMGEWTDGKNNLLPPVLEATLRKLRSND